MAGISKKTYTTKKGTVTKYVITYRDIFGKQHTAGCYSTKREALKNLVKYEQIKSTDRNITIGFLLEEYIDVCIKKNRATNTIRDYRLYQQKYLKDYENIRYNRMTSLEWQNLIYSLENEFGQYCAIGCHRFIRAALNYAFKYNLIDTNTFCGVKSPTIEKKEHNHFEVEEILKLLEVCKNEFPQYYVLLFTFVGTGMREGEILGLLKENIDFEKNRIRVCTQYTNKEFKTHTKTKQSRFVYIFPTLSSLLKEHIENDEIESSLVFHNSAGKFLNPSNLRQRFWLKLLKSCGYPKNYARLHDLRGSNTDMAITLGLSITFAKEQLGHTNELTTLRNYAKTNQTMIANGMNKFESVFEKCEQKVSKKEKSQKTNIIKFPQKPYK